MSEQTDHQLYKLQLRLDEQLKYPAMFMFKFIAPIEQAQALKNIFRENPVKVKPSRNSNYISISAELEMQSSTEIIDIYKAASVIEGVILL
jgi:uncharacterized protein